MELADFEKMEQIGAQVDAIVEDPSTAEALEASRQFCKRPVFTTPATDLNRLTTLVDTEGKGITNHSNQCDCQRRRIRVGYIIFATGEVGRFSVERATMSKVKMG